MYSSASGGVHFLILPPAISRLDKELKVSVLSQELMWTERDEM